MQWLGGLQSPLQCLQRDRLKYHGHSKSLVMTRWFLKPGTTIRFRKWVGYSGWKNLAVKDIIRTFLWSHSCCAGTNIFEDKMKYVYICGSYLDTHTYTLSLSTYLYRVPATFGSPRAQFFLLSKHRGWFFVLAYYFFDNCWIRWQAF